MSVLARKITGFLSIARVTDSHKIQRREHQDQCNTNNSTNLDGIMETKIAQSTLP